MYTGQYSGAYSENQYNQMKNRDSNGYTTKEVETNAKTDAYGNSYTTSISNDKLTNEDFLNLMIQELKLQDPTKPMDSQRMLDSQLQMSTIETNLQMAKSMDSLVQSFSQTALSNASNMIGRNIESNVLDENGVTKAYTVLSVQNVDGELQVKGRQILYNEDIIIGDEDKRLRFDNNGFILDDEGNKTGQKIVLDGPGNVVINAEGKPTILDEENNEVTDHNYKYAGSSTPVYAGTVETIPFENITKVFA